jgi:hypothetical protein
MTQWLGVFEKAKRGDEHLRAVLQRFERLICARRDHDKMARVVDDSLVRTVLSLASDPPRKPKFHSLGTIVLSTVPFSLPPLLSQAYTTDPFHC